MDEVMASKIPSAARQEFWAVVLAVLLSVQPAQAGTALDALATAWNDPLLARPPVLDTGQALPGDTAPLNCSTVDVEFDSLTLVRAVDVALCRNPAVQSAWAAIKLQVAGVGEARAAYLPSANLSISRMEDRTWYPASNLPSTNLHGNNVYGNLTWRLLDFGGRSANLHAAGALLEAALASHDAVLQQTLAEVVSAYFDAHSAQASWVARQQIESLARQTLEAAQQRERRGAGSQTDIQQAVTALAKASLEKSRAQGAYQKALSVLVFTLGVPADTHMSLAENSTAPADGVRQALNTWLEQAQARHPAIVAARAQLLAAEAKVTAVQAEGLPTLDLAGSFYQNGRPSQGLPSTRTREVMVGATLTIPLFEGFARTYKVRGAQAQVAQKEAALRDTAHQVQMEVVKVHADSLAALDNLDTSHTLLTAAQAALQSVQRKFDKGAADILEILSTQAALADAQQERIRCMADWHSARLRLLAAVGALGRQEMHPRSHQLN